MTEQEIYQSMVQDKGWAYWPDQIVRHSFYNEPIDHSPGRLAGNSHIHGDANPEVQSRVIDTLIQAAQRGGLNTHQAAYVLAIARAESGFNPDAAAGTTSAYGLGQFVKDTGAAYGIDSSNRYDMQKQAEALVVHFKENAALATARGRDESYIYKYHHDGPTGEYGGLELASKHVTPYIASYERFIEEHQRKHGTAPLDPGFDTRNHATPVATQTKGGTHAFRQGDHGDRVGELQTQLQQLGYTNLDGAPLITDKSFGPSTKAAVEAFQRDHHLDPDGIVGSVTRNALQEEIHAHTGRSALPLELNNPQHPDHALFLQTRELVYQLNARHNRTPDQLSDNLASALVLAARAGGISRIDQITLSDDASSVWAIQSGRSEFMPGPYTRVDTVQAVNTPMEQSAAAWPQAMEQFQQTQQDMAQQQMQLDQQRGMSPTPGHTMSR